MNRRAASVLTEVAPLHIGQLALRTGRSTHTIRWYETQRLIPGVRRDASGRRVYTEAHVGWLELLDRLRLTGMSIRQMREYAVLVRKGESTLEARRLMLQEHRQRVDQMLRELSDSVALIDAKIGFYGRWISTGKQPAPVPLPPARRKPG